MTRVVVLRPEPGNADTCAKLRGLGLEPLAIPVFTVVPVAWTPPDLGGFDAVLLTSANAIRHGALPDTLKTLPVIAVGDATAAAARRAGFNVAVTGTSNVDAAIDAARASGFDRLFHPAGRDRRPTGPGVVACTVYASEALRIGDSVLPPHEDLLVLIHSPRAARAFAEHVAQAGAVRSRITIAAISQAAADAAGTRWSWRRRPPTMRSSRSPQSARLTLTRVAGISAS